MVLYMPISQRYTKMRRMLGMRMNQGKIKNENLL